MDPRGGEYGSRAIGAVQAIMFISAFGSFEYRSRVRLNRKSWLCPKPIMVLGYFPPSG
jgi:hypothetical protein